MAIIGTWIRRLGHLPGGARWGTTCAEGGASCADGDPRASGTRCACEEAGDAWGWRWLDDAAQDAFALRTLRHSPGFALTAVVTLALRTASTAACSASSTACCAAALRTSPASDWRLQPRHVTVRVSRRHLPEFSIREGTSEIFAEHGVFHRICGARCWRRRTAHAASGVT